MSSRLACSVIQAFKSGNVSFVLPVFTENNAYLPYGFFLLLLECGFYAEREKQPVALDLPFHKNIISK